MKIIKLYTLLVALACFTTINAQEIKGGLRGGVNYSFFTQDAGDQAGSIGYEFGYYEVLDFENKIKLQVEINLVNNGYSNSKADTKEQFNYVEIPLLIKYEVAKNFDLGAGIKYAFGRKGRLKTEYENETDNEKTDKAESGFGFIIEGNYNMDKLNFGLRFNFNGGDLSLNEKEFQRRSVNLYVGYDLF